MQDYACDRAEFPGAGSGGVWLEAVAGSREELCATRLCSLDDPERTGESVGQGFVYEHGFAGSEHLESLRLVFAAVVRFQKDRIDLREKLGDGWNHLHAHFSELRQIPRIAVRHGHDVPRSPLIGAGDANVADRRTHLLHVEIAGEFKRMGRIAPDHADADLGTRGRGGHGAQGESCDLLHLRPHAFISQPGS